MNNRDLRAKQSLAKATESVRNKFRQVRFAHLENKRLLEEQYKPITKRLGKLIDFKEKKSKSNGIIAPNIRMHPRPPPTPPSLPPISAASPTNIPSAPLASGRSASQMSRAMTLWGASDDEDESDGDSNMHDFVESGERSKRTSIRSNIHPHIDPPIVRNSLDSSRPRERRQRILPSPYNLNRSTRSQPSIQTPNLKVRQIDELKAYLEQENARASTSAPTPCEEAIKSEPADDSDDDNDDFDIMPIEPHRSKRPRDDGAVSRAKKALIDKTAETEKRRAKRAQERIADDARTFFHEMTDMRNEEAREESRRGPNLNVLKARLDAEALLSPKNNVESTSKGHSSSKNNDEKRAGTKLVRAASSRPAPYTQTKRSDDVEVPSARAIRAERRASSTEARSIIREQARKAIGIVGKNKSKNPKSHEGSGVIDLAVKTFSIKNSAGTYTYWNDPNELVQRLRLLISSTSAGHNGHQNEISSIIEELREANIIE